MCSGICWRVNLVRCQLKYIHIFYSNQVYVWSQTFCGSGSLFWLFSTFNLSLWTRVPGFIWIVLDLSAFVLFVFNALTKLQSRWAGTLWPAWSSSGRRRQPTAVEWHWTDLLAACPAPLQLLTGQTAGGHRPDRSRQKKTYRPPYGLYSTHLLRGQWGGAPGNLLPQKFMIFVSAELRRNGCSIYTMFTAYFSIPSATGKHSPFGR